MNRIAAKPKLDTLCAGSESRHFAARFEASCSANRRSLFLSVFILAGLLLHPLFAKAEPGLLSSAPATPYLNGVFPTKAPVSVSFDGSADWVTRNYFPDLKFVEPIRIIEHPNLNKLLIVGKDGTGHLVTHAEGAADKQLFFNIQPIMHGNPGGGEGGISAVSYTHLTLPTTPYV